MGFNTIISGVILLNVAVTIQAAFISNPTSVNATLGSTATFSCSASTGGIIWLVNGSTVSELNITDITTNTTGDTSSLHIPATEQYNNTNVICSVAIHAVGFLDSDPVVLQVQGKPGAVSKLTNVSLIRVICLTWEAPRTLDISGVDSDTSYCVDISVVTVANNTKSTPLTTNCSVYMPKFNFTMDYPNTSTSVIYEFQVTPRNGAGEGPTSAPVSGFFSGPPASITKDMVEVSISTNQLDVNLLDVNLTVSYVSGDSITHAYTLICTCTVYINRVSPCMQEKNRLKSSPSFSNFYPGGVILQQSRVTHGTPMYLVVIHISSSTRN